MSIPRPRVDHPPLDKLRARLVAMGLPPPVSCKAIAPPWVHANYRLTFPQDSGVDDLLLRRRVTDPGHDTFKHELAALSALRASDLPVVRSYRILPEGTLPWPAVLSDMLPGAQGFGVLRKLPQYASPIARVTGEVVTRLAKETRPTWGTGVDGTRFVPIRDTWREEWTDRLYGWWSAAQSAGTDLGPVGKRLWDRLHDKLPALDTADTWSIVHGDIHPSNLLFAKPEGDEAPALVGVIDFESAICGDPLVDWTLLTELPDVILGHVLLGVGHERVQAVLDDPNAIARLEVYHASRAIRRMAFTSMGLFSGDGGVRRSYGLHAGHHMVREVLDRPIADKLRDALALADSGTLGGPERKSKSQRVLWQALETHRHRPAVDATRRATLCASAISSSLAETDNEGMGLEFARRIGPQKYVERLQPVPDRTQWRDALITRVVGRPNRPLALAITALSLDALDALGEGPDDWPVTDDTLTGLEVLVRQLHAAELAQDNPVSKLVSALLAMGGLRALAKRGARIDHVAANASDVLRMAWEDLTLFGDAPDGAIEPADLRAAWSAHPSPERPLIPVILWALEHIEAHPAEPARILGALGLAISP